MSRPLVEVYTLPGCGDCKKTTHWLNDHGVFDYAVRDAREYADFLKLLGHHAAPVVIVYYPQKTVSWSRFQETELESHCGSGIDPVAGVHPLIGDILVAHRQVVS